MTDQDFDFADDTLPSEGDTIKAERWSSLVGMSEDLTDDDRYTDVTVLSVDLEPQTHGKEAMVTLKLEGPDGETYTDERPSGWYDDRAVAVYCLRQAAESEKAGQWLYVARHTLGFSQRKMGELLDCPTQGRQCRTYQKWEGGESSPGWKYRREIDALADLVVPHNIDSLLMGMERGLWKEDDWHDLPVFGGTEPADTSYPIWSWDEGRVLVGSGDDLRIIQREELPKEYQ